MIIQKQLLLLSKKNDMGKKTGTEENQNWKTAKTTSTPTHRVNTNRQICGMQDLGRPHRRPLHAGKRDLDINFLGKLECNQTTQLDGHILVTSRM